MIYWLIALIRLAMAGLKSRRNLLPEILPLRHQLRDLRRSSIRPENHYSRHGFRGANQGIGWWPDERNNIGKHRNLGFSIC
jgi:hypothetical protein